MGLIERVKNRLINKEISEDLIEELTQTVQDRVLIRINEDSLPSLFESIVVDATVKAINRTYYEGISSESVSNLSTSFVEDILSEYDDEFNSYLANKSNSSGSGKIVRFL